MNQRVLVAILFSFILLSSIQNVNAFPDEMVSQPMLAEGIPIVDSPLDVVYSYGDIGNNITWEIADDNPQYWIVLRDGSLVAQNTSPETNEIVVVNVDGLEIGIYHFVITFSDYVHNTTDEVIVSVLSGVYTTHDPFSISNDGHFHSKAASEGWTGYGNETHPYVIENLYIHAVYDCISIHGTTLHFEIRNCTFVKTGSDSGIGISLQNVGNGTITDCTFLNLWVGCIAWNVLDCEWTSNIFGNVIDGIWLLESEECAIRYNTFFAGGLYLTGYSVEEWDHEVIENTVGGKPLGYFNGLNGDIINAAPFGQVIITNCSDVSIRHGVFAAGVLVGHSLGCVIEQSQIVEGRVGVFVERSDETVIYDVQVLEATDMGIHVNESTQCIIDTCKVTNPRYDGITVLMSQNATIVNTTVTGASGYGICTWESSFSYLYNNTFDHNQWGIGIGGCIDTEVISNRVRWNTEKGIEVLWGENCVFYDNAIGFNDVANAYDDGTNNFWDDGESIGNKWSDYSGVGDYSIPGSAGSIDHYPGILIEESTPIVYDTENFDYIVGATGNVIEWTTSSPKPMSYTIYKDGALNTSDTWDGGMIVIEIDGLSVGVYNFTLMVYDSDWHTASDTVIVTVNPENMASSTTTTTTTTTTTNTTGDPGVFQQITLVISLGSVVIILMVAVLAFRSRGS